MANISHKLEKHKQISMSINQLVSSNIKRCQNNLFSPTKRSKFHTLWVYKSLFEIR